MAEEDKSILPVSVFNPTYGNECAICLEDISARAVLALCRHAFCYSCIQAWLSKTISCPICTQPVINMYYNMIARDDYMEVSVFRSLNNPAVVQFKITHYNNPRPILERLGNYLPNFTNYMRNFGNFLPRFPRVMNIFSRYNNGGNLQQQIERPNLVQPAPAPSPLPQQQQVQSVSPPQHSASQQIPQYVVQISASQVQVLPIREPIPVSQEQTPIIMQEQTPASQQQTSSVTREQIPTSEEQTLRSICRAGVVLASDEPGPSTGTVGHVQHNRTDNKRKKKSKRNKCSNVFQRIDGPHLAQSSLSQQQTSLPHVHQSHVDDSVLQQQQQQIRQYPMQTSTSHVQTLETREPTATSAEQTPPPLEQQLQTSQLHSLAGDSAYEHHPIILASNQPGPSTGTVEPRGDDNRCGTNKRKRSTDDNENCKVLIVSSDTDLSD